MTYLLDTHVWLWLLADPQRIRPNLLAELRDGRTRLLLSAASSWELAIKATIGRLSLPEPAATYIPTRMQRTGVEGLAIEHVHALRVASLPPHHRDPFDRLRIAQAQVEGLVIISADVAFDAYDVRVVHA